MLSRYNVHRPVSPAWGMPSSQLHSTLNRLFQDFETAFRQPTVAALPRQAPRVRLRDDGDAVSMVADVPGLSLEDIELRIEGTVVTLKTTPKETSTPEGFTALRRERRPAALDWSFELPYPTDASAASATLEHGRLSVTLPKAPEAKPRNIPVRAR